MIPSEFKFSISPDVSSLGVTGIYFVMDNMINDSPTAELSQIRDRAVSELLATTSAEQLNDDPILVGFRVLHERVGVSNRKHVASPENLLSMLMRTGRLPTINPIVDIYNVVSCKRRLALGAHDLRCIVGNVSLRLTSGNETFVPLGSTTAKPIGRGEYAYVDDSNEILCRLEVRQVEKTKVTTSTTSCFYIVQGNAATTTRDLRETAEELIEMTQRFCGGNVTMLYGAL